MDDELETIIVESKYSLTRSSIGRKEDDLPFCSGVRGTREEKVREDHEKSVWAMCATNLPNISVVEVYFEMSEPYFNKKSRRWKGRQLEVTKEDPANKLELSLHLFDEETSDAEYYLE